MKNTQKVALLAIVLALTAFAPERLHAEGMYRPDTGGYAYLYSASSPYYAMFIPVAIVAVAGIVALTLSNSHHAHTHAHGHAHAN